MGRYWLVAVVIGTILTFAGANEVCLAFQNREQVEMSLAEFVRNRPASRWVKLTGCRVGYHGMVYTAGTRKGRTTLSDVSVPVTADGNTHRPVAVVLCVADRREASTVANFRTMGTRTETIEGVVRGGFLYSGMNKKLQKLAPWKLADSYAIIDEGRKPDMQVGATLLGLGAGMLALAGYVAVQRFSPAA